MRYRDAGVDDERVSRALRGLPVSRFGGGFAGVLPVGDGFLIACTDGVGTKTELLEALDKPEVAGWDCVAMCVNDLITTGVLPQAFLDTFLTGRFREDLFQRVLRGLQEALTASGARLVGGETAILPDVMAGWEVVGTAIAWTRALPLPGTPWPEGTKIVGLPANGFHANGYSLIRRILRTRNLSLDLPLEGETLGERLARRTALYVDAVRRLAEAGFPGVLGFVHVTGGGIPGNLSRVAPAAHLRVPPEWRYPELAFLAKQGAVPEDEQWRVWNQGVGFLVGVRADAVQRVLSLLPSSRLLGEVPPDWRLE